MKQYKITLIVKKSITFLIGVVVAWLLFQGNCVAVLGAETTSTARAASIKTAADMAVFPGVTVSPNGMAWTTDYMDKDYEHLPEGYTIEVNASSGLRSLEAGEHYYEAVSEGSVPIKKWVVALPNSQCIHPYPAMNYMGYEAKAGICESFYHAGWLAYCADCGEMVVEMLIYAQSSTVRGITHMPASSGYLYLCPHCYGLEQGTTYQHICKAISYNGYTVSYDKNAPQGAVVSGYMSKTGHMYNNAAAYEGVPVAETVYKDTRLRKNGFTCVGYVFTGWNTRPDGSGTAYYDGQEVLNLGSLDGEEVVLYAQWEYMESTLVIDANGGTYHGQARYQLMKPYGTSYTLQTGLLKPGNGYQVHFETNGGSNVADMRASRAFSHWEAQEGLQGQFRGDTYTFLGNQGSVSTIKAMYQEGVITLPDSSKSNEALAGWYTNAECTEDAFVGKPGEEVSISGDTTLYAKWSRLTLWAYDDYASHSGVGAVDLKWEQKDGQSKFYKLYQSLNGKDWKVIYSGQDIQTSHSVSGQYDTAMQGRQFLVEQTGYYRLSAGGAKGADYSSIYKGGNGGSVAAEYWLQKGDMVTFYSGTAGSGTSGGTNGAAANGGTSTSNEGRGGGAGTEIYVTRNGNRTLLLVAGGGSGANKYYGGSHGGESLTSVGSQVGCSAAYGGGGGGAQGGAAGEYVTHEHTGSASAGGGCYGETVRHYCSDGCYEITEETNGWRTDCYWIGEDYYEEWACSMCGAGTGDYHYHSTVPGGDYSQTIVHVSGGSPPWGTVCCTEEIENKICGYENGQILYYILSCTYKDLASGAVIYAKAPKGGSNYINMNFGCKNQTSAADTNGGNGYARIESRDIGYKEDNALSDVMARDTAAPEPVTDYELSISGEKQLKLTWVKPKDNGTKYYHKVESYKLGNGTVEYIAVSNVTENTLSTGVAGYHYYVDSNPSGSVHKGHQWTESDSMIITMTANVMYLHIAAVDVAGNLGTTANLRLEMDLSLPTDNTYPKSRKLFTQKLLVRDTEFVYYADDKTCYVKADGVTEHSFTAGAYLDGAATRDYQVDSICFQVSNAEHSGWLQTIVPHGDVAKETESFSNSSLFMHISEEGMVHFVPGAGVAKRSSHGRELTLEQGFVVPSGMSSFVVYPQAIAEYQDTQYMSEEAEDVTHGLTIIPDGTLPVIEGLHSLQELNKLDVTDKTGVYELTAYDTGSGLQEFAVTVINKDNHMKETFYCDAEGKLLLNVEKENPLFSGEIIISVIAVDRVGNAQILGEDGLTFTLDTQLYRERNPAENVCKTGDGVILQIQTSGYVERVEVIFPQELIGEQSDLNKVYAYAYPCLRTNEIIPFHVPLGIAEKEYEIIVRAYKDGEMLTSKPTLVVVEGNVLDELRTRIRNNG